ncbi:MAG: hypothetical protein A3I02_00380 [Betaproteobacteria bacterium RIFCSPLOWO2_02_FULL_67_26]|nr:MAG: hypothetical protein A3I02_00380 [Betaproteobacteria bacterium RIFCSPLOWO2_02_FULL_67_26]
MRRCADPAFAVLLAAGLWPALAAPPLRAWLESSMALHMLVQLPLLGAIGFCLGRAWLQSRPGSAAARALAGTQSCNAGGVTGILAASFVMILWMLPRLLDLARLDAAADALKFLTVPAAGLAVALSWPRLPAIARAVVHLEVIATLFRFGWGYLAAEERLCLAYLAGDQQWTGELLLWLGAAYAIAVTWRPMFGGAPRARLA